MAKIFYSVWIAAAIVTAIAFIIPVPMRGTVLLACGVLHGRMLARFI